MEVGSLENVCRNHPGHPLKSFPDAALLPGLVNVHSHLELTVLRGYLEGLDFWRWIRTLTRTKYEVLNEDDILTSALLGAIEAVRAGVTTVADPMDIGASLGGTVITESIFGMRGLGRESVRAVADLNLPIVLATVLLAATFIVIANIIVDLLYAVVDPRVRLS